MNRINHSSRFIEMFSTEPKMCLSEVANITMGSSPDSKYYNLEKQGLPFYQGKTEFGDLYIGEASVFCSEPVRIAEPGDILLSVRAPVGTVNLSVSKCCIGRGLASIRPKNNIEQLYLFYALRLKEADIDALGTGSTFKAINKDTLFSFRIEVGNKERQNEFVHFAKQSDKSKFNGFKSRFIEQFGNPVDVQGFGTSSIGDYCNVISGFPFKSELFNEDKAGMPLIRIRDVVRGYTGTYTTEECEQQFVVRAGDLLVGMDGDFAISAWRSEEALLNQRVCKITPKDNLITRNFIVYAVQPVLTSIEEKTNATTVKHISASQISSIRISDIDKSSVLAFDKVVQQADKSKYLN